MPGLISGVALKVGTVSRVEVAEAGNQTIVGVSVTRLVGEGDAVGAVKSNGRQATRRSVVAKRPKVDEASLR